MCTAQEGDLDFVPDRPLGVMAYRLDECSSSGRALQRSDDRGLGQPRILHCRLPDLLIFVEQKGPGDRGRGTAG